MSDITIIERSAQPALCIQKNVGTFALGKVMGPAYKAIMEHLDRHSAVCGEKDVPFTLYKHLNWEQLNKKGLGALLHGLFVQKWDMEIGIPCPETVPAEGELVRTELAPGKYLRTIHKGPYQKVGETYRRIYTYAMDKDMALGDYSVEFYLNDPRGTKAAELETEVLVPAVTP